MNEARALGIAAARAPYVLILEDHCLPYADCLEKLLGRLEDGWSAVGPGFVSGNRESAIGVAANLLTYGQWMGHRQGEERRFIAGFNSAFPTRLLLERGEICSGASHGNGGWIFPSDSAPMPGPGVIREALPWLLDPESPLYNMAFAFLFLSDENIYGVAPEKTAVSKPRTVEIEGRRGSSVGGSAQRVG